MFGWSQSKKEPIVDASTCSAHQSELFVRAAGYGDLEAVNEGFTNKTVWKDFQDKYGQTALMRAADRGHVAVVSRLLKSNVNKDIQEKRGSTALMFAASNGHREVVKLLLQAKANRDMRDESGRTAMIIAVKSGHAHVVQEFIDAGWDKDCKDQVLVATYKGWTPLMHAIHSVKAAVVDTLLRAGANVDAQSAAGTTALMLATQSSYSTPDRLIMNDIVLTLLKAGANVNKQDSFGYTALIFAARELRTTLIDYLLAAGADMTLKGKDGKTAIDYVNTPAGKAQFTSFKAAAVPGAAASTAPKAAVAAPVVPAATVAPKPAAAAPPASLPAKPLTIGVGSAPAPAPAPAAKPLTIGVGTPPAPAPAPAVAQVSKAASAPVAAAAVPQPALKPVVASVPTPTPGVSKPAVTAATPVVTAPAKPAVPLVSAPAHAPPPVVVPKPPTPVPLVAAQIAAPVPAVKTTSTPPPPATAVAPASAAATLAGSTSEPAVPAEFTEQDRAVLQSLAQSSTQSLLVHGRLNEVLLTVAAHDRTLQLLVSKQKECPSLFWFYPKKRELRNWLSNPAKCLFQDSLMMVVVCPVTLCVVQCGPKGVGWEVVMPKQWVQKWGPAIMLSIYVMQAAVLAGRVVGIPLPQLPSAANLTGLSSTVLGVGVNDVVNRQNMMKCLTEFASTTAAVLGQQNRDVQQLADGVQQQGKCAVGGPVGQQAPLAANRVKQVTDEAYKSIHTFLTTGDNAKLGKLEDQLRGRMERVMAPNGDIDWVSVEGRAMWLEKRKLIAQPGPAASAAPAVTPVPPTVAAAPQTGVSSKSVASVSEKLTPSPVVACTSWLAVRLRTAGIDDGHIQDCEQKLVKGEGFASEVRFAAMTTAEFDAAYLKSIGITARGLQMELVALHAELRIQHHPPAAVPPAPASAPAPPPQPSPPQHSSATFTSEEKSAVLQMQSTIQDLTSQLSKLRASSAAAAAAGTAPNTSSRNGHVSAGNGQVLQQAQATANAINPKTRLPYTLDDLSEEILRLQRELAQTNRDIGNVAATAEEKFEQLQPAARSTGSVAAPVKKKGWFY